MTPRQKPGRSKQDYQTPREFLDVVELRFGKITHDLAATSKNAVCDAFFGPDDDSLAQDWSRLGGVLWLNPPYANIEPWARKCAFTGGSEILLLVPASVGSVWYARYVHPFSIVHALSPRPSFDGKNPFPKDLILAQYTPMRPAPLQLWRWKK